MVAALIALVACALSATALLAASSSGERPRLTVELEPETATVGDRVHATLTLTVPGSETGEEPRFPAWGKSWGEAEILEAGPVERSPNAPIWRQRLVLAAFRTGEIALPARSVLPPGAGGESLSTSESLTFTVESVLPDDDDEAIEPAPPAPARALPAGERFWWTLAIGGLLAAVSLAAAWARGRSPRSPGTVEAGHLLPPYEELLERLGRLSSPGAPDSAVSRATIERSHVELSHALRWYLGRSLGFPATESTTTEVRQGLRDRRAPEPVVAWTEEILRACDGVKFAREPAPASSLGERVRTTRELAGTLERHLRPAAPDGGDRATGASGREAA
jgi:hypothetical protein